MKKEMIVLPQSPYISNSTAAADSTRGIVSQYMAAEPVAAWPPRIQPGAEFLPVEQFTSMAQVMEMRRTFEVTMSQAAYNKMMFFVMNAPGEVSGYGKVVRKGNSFLVTDVIVLEQENGHSHSFISEEATLKFMLMMRKRGLSDEGYNCWWHSHNDFGSFFSHVDLDQIASLANNKFTVSIVTNKMLEPKFRVDFYRPVRYAMDTLPLKVLPASTPRQAAELMAELAELTKKSPRRAR
jgi:proteasome lid subunit RPN8/RPN11